jgi:hypothetical protein
MNLSGGRRKRRNSKLLTRMQRIVKVIVILGVSLRRALF